MKAAVAVLVLVAVWTATASGAARLRVTVSPEAVPAGRTVAVRISGTEHKRCTLTVRMDRYRAAAYVKRTVGRRSRLRISQNSTPGPRVVAVRCGKARAFTPLQVDPPSAGVGPVEDELPVDELPADELAPPADELPPPDELINEGDEILDEEDLDPIPSRTPIPESKDTTKPTTPSGLSKSAATATTITLSWRASTDEGGLAGYVVSRSAKPIAEVTATTYRFTGLACGKSYSLGVAAFDTSNNTSPTATLSASTAACPDTRKVSVSKGASARNASCTVAACRYVTVSFSGYSSGNHTITCRASGGDEGGFYSYTRSGASGTSSVCFYGFAGRQVWATVDGVASSKVTW